MQCHFRTELSNKRIACPVYDMNNCTIPNYPPSCQILEYRQRYICPKWTCVNTSSTTTTTSSPFAPTSMTLTPTSTTLSPPSPTSSSTELMLTDPQPGTILDWWSSQDDWVKIVVIVSVGVLTLIVIVGFSLKIWFQRRARFEADLRRWELERRRLAGFDDPTRQAPTRPPPRPPGPNVNAPTSSTAPNVARRLDFDQANQPCSSRQALAMDQDPLQQAQAAWHQPQALQTHPQQRQQLVPLSDPLKQATKAWNANTGDGSRTSSSGPSLQRSSSSSGGQSSRSSQSSRFSNRSDHDVDGLRDRRVSSSSLTSVSSSTSGSSLTSSSSSRSSTSRHSTTSTTFGSTRTSASGTSYGSALSLASQDDEDEDDNRRGRGRPPGAKNRPLVDRLQDAYSTYFGTLPRRSPRKLAKDPGFYTESAMP